MPVSNIKKYAAGIAALAFIAATGNPVLAQSADAPPATDTAQEQITHACKVLKTELSQPGMSALMQGFPKAGPDYDPTHFRKILQDACGITLQQWTKMPNISYMKTDKVVADTARVCKKMYNGTTGKDEDTVFSAGFRTIIEQGGPYAEQSFNHACLGAEAPSAQASMSYRNPAEKMPEPTAAEVEDACARFVKTMDGHPGITIILKGHAAFPDYDPRPVANVLRSQCTIDDATWNKAPSHGWKDDKGKVMNTRAELVQYLADAVKLMRNRARTHAGFNKLIEGDEAGRAAFHKITQTAYREARPIDIVGGAPGALTPPGVPQQPK